MINPRTGGAKWENLQMYSPKLHLDRRHTGLVMMMMRMSQFFAKNSFSIGRGGWGDSVQLHGLWLFLSYITNISFPHIQIFVFHKYKQPLSLEWNVRLRRGVRSAVWVAQRPGFKSAVRVVKMILNTQCYQYLWLIAMRLHTKKLKRNTQKTKIADFIM